MLEISKWLLADEGFPTTGVGQRAMKTHDRNLGIASLMLFLS